MLKSILNLDGAKELNKKEKEQISGGFGGICPTVGDACNPNEILWLYPCLGPEFELCCHGGVWVDCANIG